MLAHKPYLKFLPACLKAWDEQLKFRPERKVLVLDNCDYAPPKGWEVVKGNFGHPSSGRNAGLKALSDLPWVFFWDADNYPAPNLLFQAVSRGMFAASNIGLFCGNNLADPRDYFVIDSGALWRTTALLHAGGWPHCWLEDWNLGVRLQSLGWMIAPLGIDYNVQRHEEQRSRTETLSTKLLTSRRVGMITLFRGDEELTKGWCRAFEKLDLLPAAQMGLTLVFDTQMSEIARRKVMETVAGRGARVTFMEATIPRETVARLAPEHERADFLVTHSHVARLYAEALNATPEETILTWEDDVRPPVNGLTELVQFLLPNRRVAAVAGLYPARHNPEAANFSLSSNNWVMPVLTEMPEELIVARKVPGGFTLWSRGAMEACPFLGPDPSTWDGWDGFMCRRMEEKGWKFWVHGGVKCEHVVN